MRKTDSVRRFPRLRRRRHMFVSLAVVLLLMTVQVMTAGALFSTAEVTNLPGFGDSANSYAWAMQWFNGKLYVGTGRNVLCLENATLDFYHPEVGYYTTNPQPGVTCPADKYDLDLRAEIWQYDPGTGAWTNVYTSPLIDNPRELGKKVARDIAYRGMVVYQGALYVAGVTADEYIPELDGTNPPRILRTTDGTTFTALNANPGLINELPGSSPVPMGFRSMKVLNDRLFVTASSGLRGDGVIMEVHNPASDNPTFTQVSPLGTMGVFEIEVFNGQLYAGTGDLQNGYGVYRTAAIGAGPFEFTPIVTGGAGRGAAISSVVSMHVFQNQLYVGASGWFSTLFPASELIRIAPDDSWQLVVGNSRQVNGRTMKALSGLPDGFGNIFNAHFWRMDDSSGALYVGTNDWSWQLKSIPFLGSLFGFQYGFDIYMSCDGVKWYQLTSNAFGSSPYNFGARTIDSMPDDDEYIGSANQVEGTYVLTPSSPFVCRDSKLAFDFGSKTGQSIAGYQATSLTDMILPPQDLQATLQSNGTALSWSASAGGDHYEVLRAVTGSDASGGSVPSTVQQAMSKLPDDMPVLPPSLISSRLNSIENLPQPYTSIGTTDQTHFVDTTAQQGVNYSYEVVAYSADGQASAPSNIAVPTTSSVASSFGQIGTAITNLGASGALSSNQVATFTSLLNQAQTAAGQSNPAEAQRLLNVLRNDILSDSGIGQADAQHLDALIRALQGSIVTGNTGG